MRRLIPFAFLALLLPLTACGTSRAPASVLEDIAQDRAEKAAESDGEQETTALNKAVTAWLGQAPTPEDRAIRAALLMAGLTVIWDARLQYGRPAPEDFNMAFAAFTRLEAIQRRLRDGLDRDWINSEMFGVTAQVGTLVGRSLYQRGVRAAVAFGINPLSLLGAAQDVAVQVGAADAAAADVEAIWGRYSTQEMTADEAWNAAQGRVRRSLDRLSGFIGVS